MIGTRHIDDEDGLPYRIVGIWDHRGFIAADRKLLFSKQVNKFDSITALDALSLTLRADPHFKAPFKFEQQENLPHSKRRKSNSTLSPSPTKYDKKARRATLQGAVGAWSGPLLHPTVGATPAGRTTDPDGDRGTPQLCHPEPAGAPTSMEYFNLKRLQSYKDDQPRHLYREENYMMKANKMINHSEPIYRKQTCTALFEQ